MKPTYSEFDNYRWINCNRWSKAKEVDALVRFLVQGLASRKEHGYRIDLMVLVLDIYHSYLCDPEQYLAYGRGKFNYIGTGSMHPYIKNHNVTYDYLVKAVNHLISLGLVQNILGKQFYDENPNDAVL